MTCRRAFEVDLPAVLLGASDDADFLAHYPSCAECATEVGVWRELDGMLRTRTPDDAGHPEPETLVAFADAPATLDDATRVEIERHLETCRVCVDELKALGGFDPTRLGSPVPITAEPRAARSAFARVVWHPAFAYALVAVLLVPIVLERWPQMETRIAEERAPAKEKSERLVEHDLAVRQAPPPPPAVPAAPAPAERPRTEAAREQKLAKQARPADAGLGAERERREVPRPPMRSADEEAQRDGGIEAQRDDGIAARRDGGIAARRDDRIAARVRAPEAAAPLAGAAPAGALRREDTRNAAPRNEAATAFADAAAPARVLELGPETPAVLAPPARGEAVRLRVTAPRGLPDGPVAVTLWALARGERLHARADRADAIAIDIPANWLVPGDYTVGLSPITETASGTTQRAAQIRFSVRASTAAESGP